ncbi:UDP-N-acetylmuramoyl-tripeptide--D-alanyl-D-alanine ligase [bacterium]|nr:UDP-N-acetylmuramoyl-tripeptide--D-alanyl-D-alanine ligase [bacterium]
MPDLCVSAAADLPGARLLFGNPSQTLTGVTIDSRDPDIRGKLFVALKGERFDGHEFLAQAAAAGAGAVLIEPRGAEIAKSLRESGLGAAVSAPDTPAALGELARRHRAGLGTKIVAITGSNGKTSAKEFVSALLSTTYRTVAAPRSFNNAIGVPLTLLSMTEKTQAGVLEIGMNHPGEIAALTRIADPDLVAITSVAPAHAGFFSGLRGIARAKSEILTAARAGIPAFLPIDSPFFPFLKARAKRQSVISFGRAPGANWRIGNVREGRTAIAFDAGDRSFRCPDMGAHQIQNVLLAIAIASHFAVPLKKIRSAVSRLRLPAGRGVVLRAGPHLIVDDSYNANPESMRAAIERARRLSRKFGMRLVLVLGDMLELGRYTAKYHRELGVVAGGAQPDRLYFIGAESKWFQRGYESSGAKCSSVRFSNTSKDIEEDLFELIHSRKRTLFLFKASQRMKLEKLVNFVCQGTIKKSKQ